MEVIRISLTTKGIKDHSDMIENPRANESIDGRVPSSLPSYDPPDRKFAVGFQSRSGIEPSTRGAKMWGGDIPLLEPSRARVSSLFSWSSMLSDCVTCNKDGYLVIGCVRNWLRRMGARGEAGGVDDIPPHSRCSPFPFSISLRDFHSPHEERTSLMILGARQR